MEDNVDRVHIKGKILIVDDSLRFLSMVSRYLMKSGYEVITEENPETAIEIFKKEWERKKSFDVVLLDLNLPIINGEEVFKRIQVFDPNVKCILSSGYPDDPIILHYADYGFKKVLTKPYNLDKLKEIIIEVINIL